MRVLHPLFVHLHIAFFLMAFVSMYWWLFCGIATSVFDNRLYRFARTNTWIGLVTAVLSMIAGARDGIIGTYARFDGPLGGWLYVKVALSAVLLLVYGLFVLKSRKKKSYLQEDRSTMVWCLLTQLVGIVLVGVITAIGTMLVYFPDRLPLFASPFG